MTRTIDYLLDRPTWIAAVTVLVFIAGKFAHGRLAARAKKARRQAPPPRRPDPQPMARVGTRHPFDYLADTAGIVPPADDLTGGRPPRRRPPVSTQPPTVLEPDYLLGRLNDQAATIERLHADNRRLYALLELVGPVDNILLHLSREPMTLDGLIGKTGRPETEIERRLARLMWVTEQVTRETGPRGEFYRLTHPAAAGRLALQAAS